MVLRLLGGYCGGGRGFPSGQRGGTQDPVVQASEGSNPSPRILGVVVWGVFGGCFVVLFVFLFVLVFCLVLCSYCFATVLLDAVEAYDALESLFECRENPNGVSKGSKPSPAPNS